MLGCRHAHFRKSVATSLANHLASIGFSVESVEEFRALADRVATRADALEVVDGYYLHYHAECGAELWLQVDREERLIGMAPHFSGDSSQRVAITDRVHRPDDSDLEGAFRAWANPADDDAERGDYPFVFDSPDYAVYRLLTTPIRVDVQIAAFAHELSAYANAKAFEAAQTDQPKLAPDFFVPIGLLAEETDGPIAQAMFAGTVLETAVRKNALSGASFIWAKVRTLGGEVDVVAEPSRVTGQVVPGGIVRGAFWLSGRIIEYQPGERRGFVGAPLAS